MNDIKLALDAEEEEAFRFLDGRLQIGRLFVKNQRSEIMYWGRGAQELFGYTEKEALGQVSHELLKTAFPNSLHAVEWSILKTGEWEGELTHMRKGDRLITVGCHQKLHERPGRHLPIIVEVSVRISKDQEGWRLVREPRK